MITLNKFVKNTRAKGKYYFTTDQAMKELYISRDALKNRIYRLKQKGEIISPAKNLYVIIPPEQKDFGCIPAEELIPILMKYKQADYYASLLTAAMYHGASHQKPQVFQVISSKRFKALNFGRVKINFLYKKSISKLPIKTITVRTGYLKVSSPELTTLDLLTYHEQAGGLNNIASILSELVEQINPKKLISLAKLIGEKTCLQRLGYILNDIGSVNNKQKSFLVSTIKNYLSKKELVYMPLAPELPVKGFSRNSKWMIIENATVESDYDS